MTNIKLWAIAALLLAPHAVAEPLTITVSWLSLLDLLC